MIPFGSDMTVRWACRAGDYILWARFQGIFSSPGKEYKIADLWELRDGNFVTLTNRHADLPAWFDLHPLEVSGSLVWWMKNRLDQGYVPQEPMDGPNLWRVFAGDRVAWVGPSRGEVQAENGVLGLVEFKKNALVYGDPLDFIGGVPSFGGFDRGGLSEEGTALGRRGWEAIHQLGSPRTVAVDNQWTIG